MAMYSLRTVAAEVHGVPLLFAIPLRTGRVLQGVPIGTVMSRLARARAQIKNYLDGGRPTLRRVK